MIGLDTNVLVRYIMQDDTAQAASASKLMESLTADEPGWVAVVSIVELVWILASSYQLNHSQIADTLDALLRTKELVVERAEVIWKALRVYAGSKSDFADCLIERCAASAGCERTMTFDHGAVKHAGMQLLV